MELDFFKSKDRVKQQIKYNWKEESMQHKIYIKKCHITHKDGKYEREVTDMNTK